VSIVEDIQIETEVLIKKCTNYLQGNLFAYRACNMALRTEKSTREGEVFDNKHIKGLVEIYREFSQSLEDRHHRVEEYFSSLLFVDLISCVELYFAQLVKITISHYPKKVGNISFSLNDVLDKSKDELVENAADQYVYKLMYKKANQILDELSQLLAINSDLLKPYWPVYIEAKTRRDLGVHNSWICNETYLRKVAEVKYEPLPEVGTMLNISSDGYPEKVVDNIMNLAQTINSEVQKKYS